MTPGQLKLAALTAQGLTTRRPFGRGREATLRALEHLGYIQIDTLAVVQRAHHHALWSRIPDYRPEYIEQLVQDGLAFEYWSHAASYLPMRDYRFALPRMIDARRGTSVVARAQPQHLRQVRARIAADGPLKARDFVSAKKRKGSWWNWNPVKRALEDLFMRGELMICARDGMEKVYDLTDRVLPDHVDRREPDVAEYAQYLVDSSLRAHGFATLRQMTHLRRDARLSRSVAEVVQSKIDSGRVVQVSLDDQPPVFADAVLCDTRYRRPAPRVRILSPFDNAVIHRDRVHRLFEFDYRLECYLPAAKRRYGYFCLPLLYRDAFVGRMDCKAHRSERRLQIRHLHLPTREKDPGRLIVELVKALRLFAAFNHCDEIELSRVSPRTLTRAIRQHL